MTRPGTVRLTNYSTTDVTVEQMGAGGFGLVFMGPDRGRGGAWRALKTLRPELLALRPQLRELFISEGLTWVGLWPHPNLLTCEAATEINGRVYLILHYAAEGSLRDLLPLGQPFALRLAWAQHIAAGLVALHTPDPEFLRPHAIVHRDLKPENVLVHHNGRAQITDFGLASAVGGALSSAPEAEQAFDLIEALAAQTAPNSQIRLGATQPAGQVTRTTRFMARSAAGGMAAAGARGGVGTLAYMPPEQWEVDGAVRPPADLYAFGLILSELLAGRHGLGDLEEARDEGDWYQLHLNGQPRPLRAGPAEGAARLPLKLETLYTALLAKRAEDRPDAGQALVELRQAAAALGEQPYTPPEDEYSPRTDEHRMHFWHNWADTCWRFERFEEALARNERALALAPDDFSVLHTRGNILGALGLQARKAGDGRRADERLEAALACHTQALALAPDDRTRGMTQDGRGQRLQELRRYAEAEAAFAAALKLNAAHGAGWLNRAVNALNWGLTEAAAGRAAEAARILAAGAGYVAEARRRGFNHPVLPELLARIQQARARLNR